MNTPEPCLCGDPYCPRRFPAENRRPPRDPDDAYEEERQREIARAEQEAELRELIS